MLILILFLRQFIVHQFVNKKRVRTTILCSLTIQCTWHFLCSATP